MTEKLCQRCMARPRRTGGHPKPFRLCEDCFRERRYCPCGKPKADEANLCQSCYLDGMKGENHPSWKGGRTITREGYVKVHAKGHPRADRHGMVWEHQIVMEGNIGRTLTREENVHHLNGIRDDNRIENLELWTKSQPAGQRVSDKLQWAKEFIARYEVSPAKAGLGEKPLLASIDFDGTLAESLWSPSNPTTEIGSPIWRNIAKAKELVARGYTLIIHTARGWEDAENIGAWLTNVGVPYRNVVCGKPLARVYVDDRALAASEATWLPEYHGL